MLRVREDPIVGRAAPVDPARRRAWAALAVVGLGFVVVATWGVVLEAGGDNLHLGFVPFYGAARRGLRGNRTASATWKWISCAEKCGETEPLWR